VVLRIEDHHVVAVFEKHGQKILDV
jgi:hypothetical protein